jgi:hypothetical protein
MIETIINLFRPLFGYKYKIVYTEINISPTLKRRYMIKLDLKGKNEDILFKLPYFKDREYMKPIALFYSKTDKYLYCRYELKSNDATGNVYRTFYK